MTNDETPTNSKHTPPIETLRHGAVSVGIFQEVSERGTYFQPGRLTRHYLDKSNEWQTTYYLRSSDLLDAALVCQDAHRRLEELRRAQRQADKQAGDADQYDGAQPNI